MAAATVKVHLHLNSADLRPLHRLGARSLNRGGVDWLRDRPTEQSRRTTHPTLVTGHWSPSIESADLRLLHWLEAGQTADKRGRELGFESKPLSTPSLQSSSSTTSTSVKGGICPKTVTLPLNSTPPKPKPMSAPLQ